MSKRKVAVSISRYSEKDFRSGGDKVDFFIVKALYELGYDVDIYCKKSDVENSIFVSNIFLEQFKPEYKQKYLFVIGEKLKPFTDILYLHENTRHYRDKYTRNGFTRLIQFFIDYKRFTKIKKSLVLEKQVVNDVGCLFLPSEYIKQDILEFFDISEQKLFILPPPVEFSDSEFYRHLIEDKLVFGLSARGFANKGGWQVIWVSFLMKFFNKNFKVLIIYPFAKTLWFVKLVVKILGLSKNIEFLDYCSNMDEFYSKIDVLIMASNREAFGLVAPEAMSRGIPVIINTRCGMQDFIHDGENGFVYDYSKPLLNLFKKMKFVIENQDKLTDISSSAISIKNELGYEQFKERFVEGLKTAGY